MEREGDCYTSDLYLHLGPTHALVLELSLGPLIALL